MNYKKGSFSWAVHEMKEGNFLRRKDWIKGLYYFTQCKELIGNNPLNRVFSINIHDSKIIDLDWVNLKPSEHSVFFLDDFENSYWQSKKIKVKGGKK